jgi:hypothetical protein
MYVAFRILDKGNEAYTSDDGILFDKNMTILIRYPQQKKGDYTVPDTVIAINYDAFDGCNELTRITIPQDTIPLEAFPDSLFIWIREAMNLRV